MDASQINKITNQLCKYQIITYFKSTNRLNEWLNNLTEQEITNIINLDISPDELAFPKELLINKNLLSCSDYQKRIFAMSKLKNGHNCWHLFKHLCSPNFLNSKYYYQDIALMQTVPTAKYILSIIDNDYFLNSKYHEEDLKMIIASHNLDLANETILTESLVQVASNKDSINSAYHRQDMSLIYESYQNNFQLYDSYHQKNLIDLAINPISLQEPYHLENMQILSTSPLASEFLYYLMTNEQIVTGQYYRKEISALTNAKSIITAIVLYCYICNPQTPTFLESSSFGLYDYDFSDETHQNLYYCYCYKKRDNNLPGHLNPEYLKYLDMLNEIDDKILPYYESLLSHKILINSSYYYQDLNLLQEVTDSHVFESLYELMTSPISLNSPSHLEDALLISQIQDEKKRKLLLKLALDENNLTSIYHRYDMKYLSKLNLLKIKPNVYEQLIYYLCHPNGLNNQEHIPALEKIAKGDIYISEEIHQPDGINIPTSLESDDIYSHETLPQEKILTKLKKIFTSKKHS